jgi:hypothetical protein
VAVADNNYCGPVDEDISRCQYFCDLEFAVCLGIVGNFLLDDSARAWEYNRW